MGETWITMVGQLISEPVRATTESGHDFVSFGMRSTERRFDRKLDEWVDGRELTVRVTCWRKLAAGVRACLGEGDPVVVTGRLSTTEEEPRSIPQLEAFSVGPNLARCVVAVRRPVRPATARPEWRVLPAPKENKPVIEAESVPAG